MGVQVEEPGASVLRCQHGELGVHGLAVSEAAEQHEECGDIRGGVAVARGGELGGEGGKLGRGELLAGWRWCGIEEGLGGEFVYAGWQGVAVIGVGGEHGTAEDAAGLAINAISPALGGLDRGGVDGCGLGVQAAGLEPLAGEAAIDQIEAGRRGGRE